MFKISKHRFKYWLLFTAVATYLLIVFGGIVRITNSKLTCPDWPTCFGDWLTPIGDDVLLGYTHRVLALIVGIMLLVAVLWVRAQFSNKRLLKLPLYGALILVIGQGVLGQLVVQPGDQPLLVAVHLGNALLILALITMATIKAFVISFDPQQPDRLKFQSPYSKISLIVLALIFVVLVSGALVSSANAYFDCTGWPLCNGRLPDTTYGWVSLSHRIVVGITTIIILWMLNNAWRSQRTQRAILASSTVTTVLLLGQVFIGYLNAQENPPLYITGLHVASAAAVWASVVIQSMFVGLAARTPKVELAESALPLDIKQRNKDLLSLTKPIIVLLLLVTTYAGMVVGAKEFPSLKLTFWTMLGGALAAGGSAAVNQYIDRELDQKMTRTSRRPIASGRMYPAEGLAFGLGALFVAFYMMAGMVNLLAALLSLTGMIYYIVIYSIYLKTATVQNIVIGGGAGAIPPMVGWAAATGSLDPTAYFLFAIIFMWTPPHFWALALIRKKEYAKAGIPMMPVVRGEKETRWQIMIYTIELVVLTLLMPIFNMAGIFYLISAFILGGGLLYFAWKVWRNGGNKIAWRMYRYSSMYLALLFAALMVDALL